MKKATCTECKKETSLSETFTVQGIQLCKECAEKKIEGEQDISQDEITKNIDMTVCANCERDNGETPYDTIVDLPFCNACQQLLRNRPFPLWIKAALAGLIIVLVVAFIYNGRFLKAYSDLQKAFTAIQVNEFETASSLLNSVVDNVPENTELKGMASYYAGIVALNKDETKKALEHFSSITPGLFPDTLLMQLKNKAKIGIAFKEKDYDTFLSLAIEMRKSEPQDPILTSQVASAYACKYVQTGDQKFHDMTTAFLDTARQLCKDDTAFIEYEDRILCRLETREMLNIEDFTKRYPNGWNRKRSD